MSETPLLPRRPPVQSPAQPDQGLSFGFVLAALRRWWKIALPVALLLAGAGATVVYLLFEPVYEASAWFQIEERTPYLAFESKEEGRSKLFFQTQIEMIRSPLVLAPITELPEIAKVPEIARQADKVAFLAKQIKVAPVGESELFRILYAGPDPKNAANVVNAVTESYFKLRDQSDGERNQRIIELLNQEKEKRMQTVKLLQDQVHALAAQASVKDPFAAKRDSNSPQQHPLAELESRLIDAQVQGTVLDARIKAAEETIAAERKGKGGFGEASLSEQEIKLRDTMAERAIEESEGIKRLRAVIAGRREELAADEQLLAKGRTSPTVERLKADISVDEQSLARMREEMKPRARREAEAGMMAKQTEMGASQIQRRVEELDKMQSERATCRAMEQLLQRRYNEQRKNVEQSSGDTLELGFKLDEVARAEKVFELIAQRAVELQTERVAPARINRLKAAEPPALPDDKFLFRNLLVVVLICLAAPFALAVCWERLIGRVNDPLMLERQAKLAVVGEIAQLPVRAALSGVSASTRIGRDLRLFEESIDSLRTSLTLSSQWRDMRILAVTSAASREGKTSVACQLAVSFARATGKPLLLIDGDMRCPDVHNVFGVDLQPGLSKVLSGDCPLEAAIVPSDNELVHLLPAGRLEVNPHSLLGNGAWTALLAQIPSCYRYVLIDTPPMLSASEALVFAKAADASLVCVMRDVSRVDQLRRVLSRLEAAGSQPVGLVLNGMPVRNYSYRWGDYQYGGSRRGSER